MTSRGRSFLWLRAHSLLLVAVLFMSHTLLKTACFWHSFWKLPAHKTHTHTWNMFPYWLNVIKASNGCVTVPWRHGMVCSIRGYTFSILRVVAFRVVTGYKGTLMDMQPAIVTSRGNCCATLYRIAHKRVMCWLVYSSSSCSWQPRGWGASPECSTVLPELRHALKGEESMSQAGNYFESQVALFVDWLDDYINKPLNYSLCHPAT